MNRCLPLLWIGLLFAVANIALAAPTPIPARPADPSQPISALPVPVAPQEVPVAPAVVPVAPQATPETAPNSTPADATTTGPSVILVADFSLRKVVPELVQNWVDTEELPVKVVVQFRTAGATRDLVQKGADGDIVISANAGDVVELANTGLLHRDGQQTLARNELAVIGRHPVIRDEDSDWWDLVGKEWRHVVVADGDVSQLGRISLQALKAHDLADPEALKRVRVIAPNEALVLSRLGSTQADAALVYKTDLLGVQMPGFEPFTMKPTDSAPVLYTGAVTSRAKDTALCERFLTYCVSDEARAVFKKYGFELP